MQALVHGPVFLGLALPTTGLRWKQHQNGPDELHRDSHRDLGSDPPHYASVANGSVERVFDGSRAKKQGTNRTVALAKFEQQPRRFSLMVRCRLAI